MFSFHTASLATGRTYRFVDECPPEKSYSHILLCLHGFPDSWFGWRNQIGPWSHAGYRVIVPDMLGYGGTDKPSDASEYSMKKLCADLASLLDHLSISKAVVIGHDWGSFTAGRFALWYPERLSALILISVPYTPPSPKYLSVEDVAKIAPNLLYQTYLANPVSTKEIEANLETFLYMIFAKWKEGSNFSLSDMRQVVTSLKVDELRKRAAGLLSKEEMDYYLNEFKRGGMNGPLSYYRTAKVRHEEEQAAGLPAHLPSNLPVLFLWGTKDTTIVTPQTRKAAKFVPNWQDIAVENKGHWLLVEAKDFVNNAVTKWLHQVLAARSAECPTQKSKL